MAHLCVRPDVCSLSTLWSSVSCDHGIWVYRCEWRCPPPSRPLTHLRVSYCPPAVPPLLLSMLCPRYVAVVMLRALCEAGLSCRRAVVVPGAGHPGGDFGTGRPHTSIRRPLERHCFGGVVGVKWQRAARHMHMQPRFVISAMNPTKPAGVSSLAQTGWTSSRPGLSLGRLHSQTPDQDGISPECRSLHNLNSTDSIHTPHTSSLRRLQLLSPIPIFSLVFNSPSSASSSFRTPPPPRRRAPSLCPPGTSRHGQPSHAAGRPRNSLLSPALMSPPALMVGR